MMMICPMIALALYIALIVFGIWVAYTLVMAIVRISHAMERVSSSLAEIANNRGGATSQSS
jgi:uncharacterized membrane protein